jgi:hypothetical protein
MPACVQRFWLCAVPLSKRFINNATGIINGWNFLTDRKLFGRGSVCGTQNLVDFVVRCRISAYSRNRPSLVSILFLSQRGLSNRFTCANISYNVCRCTSVMPHLQYFLGVAIFLLNKFFPFSPYALMNFARQFLKFQHSDIARYIRVHKIIQL